MDDYVVYYKVGDIDKVLFVKPYCDLTKSDAVVYHGSQKSCKLYVLRHQNDEPSKRILQIPPP